MAHDQPVVPFWSSIQLAVTSCIITVAEAVTYLLTVASESPVGAATLGSAKSDPGVHTLVICVDL